MSIFERIFNRQTVGNPKLARMVRAWTSLARPTPADTREIYRQILNGTLLVLLSQRGQGLKNGALVTPSTSARVEFATTVNQTTNEQCVVAFADIDTLANHFSFNTVPQTGVNVPYVGMHARDLFTIVAANSLGMDLRVGKESFFFSCADAKEMARGVLPAQLISNARR